MPPAPHPAPRPDGAPGSASAIRTDRLSLGARLVAGWGRWADGVRRAATLTLGRPALWPVALVGFLARGGIALFLLAVVTPPSPVGLANLVGPTAITPTGLDPMVVGPFLAIVVATTVGVLLAMTLGAWADASIALVVHPADGRPGSMSVRVLASVVAVRILVAVPVALVAALVIRSIIQVAYDQLVLPSDLSVPLAWRVAHGAAGPVAVIVIAWQIVEVVGGIAARRVVLFGEPVLPAVALAVRHVVRHPATTAATAALGVGGLAIALVPAIIALGVSGAAVAAQLAHGSLLIVVGLVAALFVAVWLGGLVMTAVAAAWRSMLWSVEVARLGR